MKTIEIKLYKFGELSEDAKEHAIEKWRETTINEGDYWFIEEAHESFKKFADIFGIKWYEIDYTENYRSSYSFQHDDDVLSLSGSRLISYLWNNYKDYLYRGKYRNVKSDKKLFHKRIKSKVLSNGKLFQAWHSAIFLDNCCPLTGVCYDDSLLKPIFDFMENPNNNDFSDLLHDCINSLCHAVQSEIEYTNSDEAIIETIEANEYDFTEDGEVYLNTRFLQPKI